MAITTTEQTSIIKLVLGMFNAAPGATNLSSIVAHYEANGKDLANLADAMASNAAFTDQFAGLVTVSGIANKMAANFGLTTGTAYTNAVAYFEQEITAGKSNQSIMKAAVDYLSGSTVDAVYADVATTLTNKYTVALDYSVTQQISGATFAALQTAVGNVDATAASVTAAIAANSTIAGASYTLTTGTDAIVGTTSNDTINGGEIAGANSWTVGDTIDGGAGTDTFTIIDTTAVAIPVAATVTNVETINATGGTTVTLNTTGFSGLTTLNTTSVGGNVVTAAATTAVTANQTDAAGTNEAITINGGSTVTVNSTANNADAITVGATTAAAGAVTVNSTGSTAAATDVLGAIAVTGGTTVTVTQTAANLATTGNTSTAGDVTVTGNASTTAVTVTDTAAATGFTATSTIAGVIGHVNGAVDILDVNRASTTAAGTITTATVGSGAAVTVNSGALTTLNASGKMTTLDAGTLGALTTAANTTLALNLTGLTTTGNVTIDNDIKTLNISSNTTASTLANLINTAFTTLNVSGDAKLTITDFDPATLTAVTVTNTGGLVLGTSTLATTTTFTGGAGADSVKLGITAKTIDMGDGNDTVTYAGIVATGGSVAGGAGTDTIVMTSTEAAASDGSATFNTKNTGFETLKISGAFGAGDVIDVDGLNNVSKVIVVGGTGHAANAKITNIDSGGTVEFRASIAGLTVDVQSAVAGATDVLNVALKSTAAMTHTSFTSSNVETVNIDVSDNVALGSDAVTHIISTLALAGTTTLNVSGNNGLTISAATGSTAVTTFDASGVVANNGAQTAVAAATTDTAVKLAVSYTSLNATTNAAVTITGGAGNDTLVGSTAAVNVDTITGGEGADNITGGTGNDIINLTETVVAVDNVNFSAVATNGNDTITGFGSTDTITTELLAAGNVAGETAIAANAAATDLTDQFVAVFADGADGTGTDAASVILDYTDMTDVAAFLNAGLTILATETFAVVINDLLTDKAYVYNVDPNASVVDTSITAAEVTTVGVISLATADTPFTIANNLFT